MKKFLQDHPFILMEAAVAETLFRTETVELHPRLLNATLIYDGRLKEALKNVYRKYVNIALEANLPILLLTPTWRTNHERVSEFPEMANINKDAAMFMRDLRDEFGDKKYLIKIGGLIGPKGDAYNPKEGLSVQEAEGFHSWQLNQLAESGVDYLIVETAPCLQEAIGIAKAMLRTHLPYIISFVINRQGQLLDGTPLMSAISIIDRETSPQPLCYLMNCAYPTFLCAKDQPPAFFERFMGGQANGSSLDHSELDGSEELQAESVSAWGDEMIKLYRDYGVKILGGCCGTRAEHLEYLVKHILAKNKS